MNWQKRLDFIAETKKKVFETPASAAKKLKAGNKKTAIERMNALFDEGTFVETGAFIKKRDTEIGGESSDYEGVVTGYGAVDGRLVFAYAQDFSRKSGALSEAGVKKILSVYSMAEKNGAPIVSVFDSSGAVITEGIDALAGYGAIVSKASILSGVIPQYSVICGTCAGGAAMIASVSDFILMEKNSGKLFITSPFVIKNTSGADDKTGGAENAAKTGQCAKVIESEEKCFAELRALLEYIPSNNLDDGIYTNATDEDRLNETIADMVTAEEYDIKQIIAEIADNGRFFELYEDYADNIVCGFISVFNVSAGIVANQPLKDGGAICPQACDKAARFISVCNNFNIPVITLVDTNGMAISEAAENAQFALCAAKLASAYAIASVPKITLNIGRAYGAGYMAMGSKGLGADIVMAYPTAQISVLAPDTAVELLYGKKIASAANPMQERAKFEEEWAVKTSSPVEASSSGQIDNIIEPNQTRQMIASSLMLLQAKREMRPPKKQSGLPLRY